MGGTANGGGRRIEAYRADLGPDEVEAAELAHIRSVAALAYQYALPSFLHLRQLTEFIQGRRYFAPDECPLGGWVLMRDLATPATTTVSPNVDTLYGASYVLLDRQGPVVIRVPAIPDRYFSVALLDTSFDNFAILSPRTAGNTGGAWLLVPPGWDGEVPAGMTRIDAPTFSVCLLQRIFIRDASELERVRAWQDKIAIEPLGGGAFDPALDLSDLEIVGMRDSSEPLEFFAWTNAYVAANQSPDADATLNVLFASVGVGPGAVLPMEATARTAIVEGARDGADHIDALVSTAPERGGWQVPATEAGRPGPDFARRAAIQISQMGLFPNEEAMYFFAFRDADGSTLDGNEQYRISFAAGATPPLAEHGFWSLTMYGADSLLVDNPLDRYELRPGSSNLVHAADGTLTVVLSAARPEDVPEANWLPAPDGPFNVALRTYQPAPAIVDGSWFPPPVVRR